MAEKEVQPLRTGCLDWPPHGAYFDARPNGILEVRVPLDEAGQAEGTRITVEARHDEGDPR